MISTCYKNQALVWEQAVELKAKQNSLKLDQGNATPLNRRRTRLMDQLPRVPDLEAQREAMKKLGFLVGKMGRGGAPVAGSR
jgi:hypothetical protein